MIKRNGEWGLWENSSGEEKQKENSKSIFKLNFIFIYRTGMH